MRKYWGLFAVLALVAAPALAQDKPGNVTRVFVTQVKPGMSRQYEEGRKRHMDWHRKQNDSWSWHVYLVLTGEAEGRYLVVTENHYWKDFDTWDAKMAAADEADGTANMEPYTAGGSSSFYKYLADVSKPQTSTIPARMAEVIHFMVRPDKEADFSLLIKKIDDAIKKTNWPVHYSWYELVNGGEQPHFVLVIPHENWASMAEPEVSFPAMLEKAFGRLEAGAILEGFGKTIKSQSSEMLQYRPELSYRPTAK